jgi:ATP-dependent DNA ligase
MRSKPSSAAQAIAQDLSGRSAILDGECPGLDGRPMFYELMRRRGPFCFYAFDLLWLDGSDLRDRPLFERKKLLRKLLPLPSRAVLYVEHVANGTDLFRVICDRDMEGIVAKQANARYTPEATSWVKIKNRQYRQAVGAKSIPGNMSQSQQFATVSTIRVYSQARGHERNSSRGSMAWRRFCRQRQGSRRPNL